MHDLHAETAGLQKRRKYLDRHQLDINLWTPPDNIIRNQEEIPKIILASGWKKTI